LLNLPISIYQKHTTLSQPRPVATASGSVLSDVGINQIGRQISRLVRRKNSGVRIV